MPTDAQIIAAGTAATPLDYIVPNAQELIPLSVNANFDGSGAGGDYLPCVVFISDAGVVIARSALSDTVAAGDDAEVSWFPGVTNAAAAAATGLDACIAVSASPYNIPATGGAPTAATTWDDVRPLTGSFSWPVGGDATKIALNSAGLYRFSYTPSPVATWPAPATGFVTFFVDCATFGTGFQGESRFLNTTTSALFAGVGSRKNQTLGIINLPAADVLQLFAGNSTVGNFVVSLTSLYIERLGDNIAGTVI